MKKHVPAPVPAYATRGEIYFQQGRYREAYADFFRAVELLPDEQDRLDCLFNLALTSERLRLYRDAWEIYRDLLVKLNDSARQKIVREKIRSLRRLRHLPGTVKLKCDDRRLEYILKPMLADYCGLTKPVNLWWVERSHEVPERIAAMEELFGVEPEKRVKNTLWSALSHFPCRLEHFIFLVREDWEEARDDELRGVIAHELAHEEWKETGGDNLFSPGLAPDVEFSCREKLMDLLVVGKGYGWELLASRTFQEKKAGRSFAGESVFAAREILRLVLSGGEEIVARQKRLIAELQTKPGTELLVEEERRKLADFEEATAYIFDQ